MSVDHVAQPKREEGSALVLTLMAMLLLSAIGTALVLTTTTDALIAANQGAANEAFYAAEAAFERTCGELGAVADLTAILNGSVASQFTDGPSSGARTLGDGSSIDLSNVEHMASCAKAGPCTDADLAAPLRGRPWGSRNPRWRLFSWGPLTGIASGQSGPPLYVVAFVADDPADADGDPWSDGLRTGPAANPGAGVILVRAEAFGRRRAHRTVEGTIVRQDLVARARWEAADPETRGPWVPAFPILQVLAWREVR